MPHQNHVSDLDEQWARYAALRAARTAGVRAWSLDSVGLGDILFKRGTIHAEASFQSIDAFITASSQPDISAQFHAVQLQMEFGIGRLLNARDLLLSGFLFDGGGLLRVAWESITRAALFVTDQEAAAKYMAGEELGNAAVRKALEKLQTPQGEQFKKQLDSSWATLSQFSHSYSIRALHLQMEPQKEGRLLITSEGVRRERELLIMFTECVHLVDWISRLLSPFGQPLSWEPQFLASMDALRADIDEYTGWSLGRVEALRDGMSE